MGLCNSIDTGLVSFRGVFFGDGRIVVIFWLLFVCFVFLLSFSLEICADKAMCFRIERSSSAHPLSSHKWQLLGNVKPRKAEAETASLANSILNITFKMKLKPRQVCAFPGRVCKSRPFSVLPLKFLR